MDTIMNGVDPNQMQYPPSISSSFEQLNDPFCNSSVFMYHRRKSAVSINQNPSTNHFLAAIDGGLSSLGWQYDLLPQNTEVQIPWQCDDLPYDLNLPPICTVTSADGISSLGPATPVRRRGDEEVRVQIMDSVNGNCEVIHGNLLKLFAEMNPGLEVGDLRKTPRQKERRKKHRPKVVKEAKKKAPPKKRKVKAESVKESENNNGVKPLRKYVRRKGLNKELKGGEKKDCGGSCRRGLNFEPDHHLNSEDFLTLSISSSICESKFATPVVERDGEVVMENRKVCRGLWFDFENNGHERYETDIYANNSFFKDRCTTIFEHDGVLEERSFSEINGRREDISEESLARITRSRFNKSRRSVSISFPEGCKKRRTERCQSSISGGGDGQGCIRQEGCTRNQSEYGEARSLVDGWSSRDICFGEVPETFEAEKMVVFHTEMGPMALRVPKKKREKRRGRKERGFVGCTTSCIEALVSGMQTNVRKKKRSKKTSEKNATQLKNVGVYFDYQHIPSYSNEHIFTYNLEADIEILAEKLKNIDIFGYKREQMIVPYIPGNGVSGAMVVYERDGRIVPVIRKRKPRAKVELDEETSRVWKLLMGNINDEGVDGDDEVKARWWEKERRTFSGRADSFIARMRLVQGDRRFSPWKGSVVDSVIGVFLTQNVSDHLSSSAFMSMAAHFPLKNKGEKGNKPPDETPIFFVEEPVELPEEDYSPATMFFLEEKSRCTTPEPHHIPSSGETTTSHEGRAPSFTVEEPGPDPEPGNSIQFDDPPMSGSPEVEPDKSDKVSNKTMGTLYSLFLQEEPDSTSVLLDSSCLHLHEGNKTDSRHEETKPELGTESEENGMKQSPGEDSTGKTAEKPVDLAKNKGNTTEENDIRFCQSSGISSQHSDDSSVVLTSERVVHSPQSTCESEEIAEVDLWDSSISFMDLLQMAETSTLNLCDSTQFVQPYGDGIQQGDVLQYRNDSRPYIEIMGYDSFRNSKEQHEGSEQSTGESASQVINEEYDGIGKVMENTEVGGAPSVTFESLVSGIHNSNGEKSISVSSEVAEKKEYGKSDFMKNKLRKEKESRYDWASLRKETEINGKKGERNESTMDSLDWEAVRRAEVREVAETIKERGMNNVLAGRIKDFLDRLVREQGSIDLEWLRDVEPDKAKEYLLSIRGLGLKSVECVRLLTLHHLAFPVDTNVGRIVVRLGWVPLQPLPESLQLHLLELYPMLETIQKYLWPRLCKLDQKTLYELHYQMITFGKVFCTKNKPNCNSCPMRGECRHFASAFASARLALPGPEEKGIVSVRGNTEMVEMGGVIPLMLPSIEVGTKCSSASVCEPIIEEPPSPEPAHKMESDIEDVLFGEEDEIPTIKLNIEEFSLNLQTYIQNNMELEGVEMSKALVALTPEAASIPMPKMKNVSRLRTEHQVYELPDSHPLLEGMDRREPDDPCSYLLAIWTPGETANSIEPPERKSESCEFGQLCSEETCSLCGSRREAESQTVRGTLLIPCRTAMRGSFPLNGTYFQVNEVFADHDSSINPIDVPRSWIWNLHRRTVYFGSSIPTIFRGLTTEGIQHCFWRGYVCVRGFDQKTRAPRPLMARLHLPASKLNKRKDNGAPNRSEANPVVPKVSISLENAVSGEPTQQQRLQLVL